MACIPPILHFQLTCINFLLVKICYSSPSYLRLTPSHPANTHDAFLNSLPPLQTFSLILCFAWDSGVPHLYHSPSRYHLLHLALLSARNSVDSNSHGTPVTSSHVSLTLSWPSLPSTSNSLLSQSLHLYSAASNQHTRRSTHSLSREPNSDPGFFTHLSQPTQRQDVAEVK